MNSDHVVGGISVTTLHGALTTVLHYLVQIDIEIAQAFSILGLSIVGGIAGVIQWWLKSPPPPQ